MSIEGIFDRFRSKDINVENARQALNTLLSIKPSSPIWGERPDSSTQLGKAAFEARKTFERAIKDMLS